MKKKKNKIEKYKVFNLDKLRKGQLILATIVGIIFLVLLTIAMTNIIFLPATLISFSLFLFCICFYYLEDKGKKKLVYTLFGIGVLFILIEVIYILVSIC